MVSHLRVTYVYVCREAETEAAANFRMARSHCRWIPSGEINTVHACFNQIEIFQRFKIKNAFAAQN